MFIPIHDSNPLRRIETPYATRLLILLTVAVFVVFQSGLVAEPPEASLIAFAMIPAELGFGAERAGPVPAPVTLLSYMFLHGGWLHLIGNMLFLWVFGDNVEDAMGHLRFLVFYPLCGIAAALAHAAAMPGSAVPLIGASGAVAGVLAAYLILHPKVKIWVLFLGRIPLRLTAMWALGGWILFQVFNIFVALPDDATAWWAHVGGLVAGAVMIPVFRKPGVPLFDRGLPG